jgi:hypothetical protein
MTSRTPHNTMRHSRHAAWLFIALLVCVFGLQAGASSETSSVSTVKAAFIYNFTKFITWPATSFREPTDPIVITVVDDQAFARVLEDAVRDRTVHQRAIVVKTATLPDERSSRRDHATWERNIQSTHMVYAPQLDPDVFERFFADIDSKKVVAIGEGDTFTAQHGMMSFVLVDRKVAFNINMDVLEESQVEMSSKLLRLARIVRTKGD